MPCQRLEPIQSSTFQRFQITVMKTAMILLCLVAAAAVTPLGFNQFGPTALGQSGSHSNLGQTSDLFGGKTQVSNSGAFAGVSNCCIVMVLTARIVMLLTAHSSQCNRRFHDGLRLFQFDTIAPNLVPSVSNYLIQLSEWEQMKKVPKSEIDLFDMICYFDLSEK